MPICNECTTPCNCLVSEDGFRAGRGVEDGRRNTNVTGVGTVENPYVIEFQQSGLYRPPSGEIHKNGQITFNATGDDVSGATVQWESPTGTFTFYLASFMALTTGNFHVVGANCVFPANATGTRRLEIIGIDEEGNQHVVAGDSQTGSAARATRLSCSAFTAGLLTPNPAILPIFSNPKIDVWTVGILQDSGGSLTADIKFWMTTL